MPTQLINLSTRLRVETGECVAIAGFIVFFFASRRLHTSSLCDWSSDVCSSELRGRWLRRRALDAAVAAPRGMMIDDHPRSEEHTSELQSHSDLVCRLLLEKK